MSTRLLSAAGRRLSLLRTGIAVLCIEVEFVQYGDGSHAVPVVAGRFPCVWGRRGKH